MVVPGRRPNVNAILKLPLIQNRIKTNLSTSIVATEFSHTVLHRQDVYQAARHIPMATPVAAAANTPTPAAAAAPNKSYLP